MVLSLRKQFKMKNDAITVIENTTPLYKRDTKDKVRIWSLQVGKDDADNGYHRTLSGIKDGKIVYSTWKKTRAKNAGKKNATTSLEQAFVDVSNRSRLQKEGGEYFEDINEIDNVTKIKVMLAETYSSKSTLIEFDFEKEYLISQPKLDGIRCATSKDGMFTRGGKKINTCLHIWNSLVPFFIEFPSVVIDGELYNHELKENFNKISSLVRKESPNEEELCVCQELMQYHVYDFIAEGNFEERFDKYAPALNEISILPTNSKSIFIVKNTKITNITELDSAYQCYLEDGYEGQMVRFVDSEYEGRRSKSLWKRKEFITEEFAVDDILEGSGNWAGYIKRFCLSMPNGAKFRAGVRGDQELMRELFLAKTKPDWCTLRYFALTPDGIPRFPVVIDWGQGKRND